MLTQRQKIIKVNPSCRNYKQQCSITRFFILILIIAGCSTTSQRPWPLQSDGYDVYKYYEGPELPMEALALLDIDDPVAIKFENNYYNGTFAVAPGKQTIELWYTETSAGKRTASSRSIVPTTFTAFAGRRYKAFANDFFDDTSVPPNYWHPLILDITDDGALTSLVKESPHVGVRVEALDLITDQKVIYHVAKNDQESRVRAAAMRKLTDKDIETISAQHASVDTGRWQAIPTSEYTELTLGTPINAISELSEKTGKIDEIRRFVLTLQEGDPSRYRPIFCLHPPIGAINYLANMVRHLHPDQPVYGVQSPAFDGIRDPFDDIEEMAAYYIKAIRVIQPNGPYVLLGHSSGAYIAYEMAVQLEKDNVEVPLLVVVDERAPLPNEQEGPSIMDIFEREDLFESAEVMYFTAWAVSLAHGKELTFTLEDLLPLTTEQRYANVTEFLKHAGFVPQNADNDIVRVIMHMYASHSTADESYLEKHKELGEIDPYTGHVVLFRSTEETTYEGTDITEPPDTSECSNWDKFCSGPIDVVGVPDSNHITMIMEPCVKFLGEHLQSYLDELPKPE